MSELKENNYVPYSGKHAYCVTESEQGHLYPGVRIENSVFPLTISEVQSAIFTCLSEGKRPRVLYTEDPENDHLRFWKREYDLSLRSLKELEKPEFAPVLLTENNLPENELMKTLLERAITINSDFPVSALLKTDQGIITGVNIECSEWSLGLCAERIALAKAISYGIRNFHSLYVHTRYGEFSSPCGACRQVIIEHMPRKPVHLYHANHTHSIHYSSDLLPYSFRSSTLQQD